MKKESQSDYSSEYFQGQVPDYNVGTGVDFSQISSAFSKASETMELVYEFAPDISRDVSYIFDFSNQGAFGVYIPALVEQVKTNELKNRLEQKNYEVKYENNTLVAYPKDEEIDNETVQREIETLWNEINAGKSEIIGVNMNKVKSTTEQNMRELVQSAQNDGIEIQNPQLLWEMLIMLELGATIIHEWEHSRGGDEAASQMREKAFINSSIEKVKQKYEAESGQEMPISHFSRTKTNNWYKLAQSLNYLPSQYKNSPAGSDLSGRMGHPQQSHSNVAEWGRRNQLGLGDAVESRLGRQFMWPLSEGLIQEHQTVEEQLRRQTENDCVADNLLVYEKLLSKDRDDSQAYKTIEQLMEEKRPQPIMVPIEKTASGKLTKNATLFGWYNNLEISDGSTIPGLGDRVMAWDDRDEDFSREESWIKQQPRYNPSYDLKGFYFRWIEPRFKPQLFDDMTQDYSNTHPAKRFASANNELSHVLKILDSIKGHILKGDIKSSRIVVTSDLYPLIKKVLNHEGILIKAFHFGETSEGEKVYAVWIADSNIEEELLKNGEKAFRSNSYSKKYEKLVDDLLGVNKVKEKAIKEIINVAQKISKKAEIKKLYLVGACAREKRFNNENNVCEELNFSTGSLNDNLIFGNLLVRALGVDFEISNYISFSYKNIKVEICIKNAKSELKQIKSFGIRNQLIIESLKRDFTINMFAWDIINNKIEDPCNVAEDDFKNNIIRTFFDSKKIIKNNPIIILRALKLKLKYNLSLEKDLEKNILIYGKKMLQSKCDEGDLLFARESIRIEDRNKADQLFDDFNLEFIKKIK